MGRKRAEPPSDLTPIEKARLASLEARTRRTPERATVLLGALVAGNTRRASAAFAGMSHDTFYNWFNDDPDFRARVEEAEAKAQVRAVSQVANAAFRDGDWRAAAWWLERRYPADYGRRDRVEMSIDVKRVAAEIAEAEGLDPAELVATAELIATRGRSSGSTEDEQ